MCSTTRVRRRRVKAVNDWRQLLLMDKSNVTALHTRANRIEEQPIYCVNDQVELRFATACKER